MEKSKQTKTQISMTPEKQFYNELELYLDRAFPKGDKDRGVAMVMLAFATLAFTKVFNKIK